MIKSDNLQALAEGDGEFMVTDCDRVHVWQHDDDNGLQNASLGEAALVQMLAAVRKPRQGAALIS